MAENKTQQKDNWSSSAYQSAASFVPLLTSTVMSYLDVQPTDQILDVGCGDGVLTARIANLASAGRVLGLDSSASFITTAKQDFQPANCSYVHHDATQLATSAEVVTGKWDKVFSNAAMHWILRQPETRTSFFRNIHQALRPGGKFVFEMGGHGNVAEIQAAAVAALVHAGLSLEQAREATPWFFPSVDWMTETLQAVGFQVDKCELEYRPTKLTPTKPDGSGGLEGWVRLMCVDYVNAAPEGKHEQVEREIIDFSDAAVTRKDREGAKYVGNVRLRVIATKIS